MSVAVPAQAPPSTTGDFALAFASPIFRANIGTLDVAHWNDDLLPPIADLKLFNDKLTTLITRVFNNYTAQLLNGIDHEHADTLSNINNLFFDWQLQGGFQEHFAPEPVIQDMLQQILKCVVIYQNKSHTDVRGMSDIEREFHVSMWASVQANGTMHPMHVHPDSTIAGTYYIQTPTLVGDLLLSDPRGALSDLESIRITPTPGDLILFPPWLPHQVLTSHTHT